MTTSTTALATRAALPELRMAGGLPGFPGSERYALVEVTGSDVFLLRSLDEDGLEFVVVPPALFFPDYAPEVDDDAAAALGLETADDALVLVVVTLAGGLESATCNLRAPVVVNRRTRQAAQVLLADDAHSLREPLRAA
jgi:flagellar assembly factor FliW